MKVYREVIIRGNEIYWIGSQMFSTKEGVLEALNQRAEKNEGNERNILLHVKILSPFNDDPVIIIKQKGV